MAHPAAANTYNYLFFGQNNFNVVLHSQESNVAPRRLASNFPHEVDRHVKMSSLLAIFVFTVTVLLNLVQIKFQGRVKSPFETHPKTMLVVIVTLLLYYCLSSYVAYVTTNHATISTAPNHYGMNTYYHLFIKVIVGFCASLLLASIVSVLLPGSLCPLVYTISILFSLFQLLPPSRFRIIWEMLIKKLIYITDKFRREPPHHPRRRRSAGGVQIQMPWLPQLTTNAISNQVEILPV